ncbi:MAG: hypothetical protein HQ475_11055 [SAR202 cluster bacterium]|nr:hypothetical protein [SAR202 cluster bacterium]
MDTSDQVLSQNQIDAMFTASGSGSGGPPEDVPEHPLGPRPDAPIREAETGNFTMESMGKRLEKLEQDMVKLGHQAGTPSDITASVKQLQQDIQTLVGHIQAMNTKIETVVAGLGGTVGYAAHESFQCKECQVKGNVAAELSCTSCGTKSWWGWFPPPAAT